MGKAQTLKMDSSTSISSAKNIEKKLYVHTRFFTAEYISLAITRI